MPAPADRGLFAVLSAGLGLPFEATSLPQSPEAWHEAAQRAVEANVEPQAFLGAKRLAAGSAPPPAVLDRWREAFASSAIHHDRLRSAAAPILGSLHRAGIPVVILKGAYLATAAYPHPGARPMNDIDLLIRASDLPAVHLTLTSAEWMLASDLATNIALDNQASYKHAGTGLSLDLHWSVLGRYTPFRMPDVAVWSAARPAQIGLPGTLCLSPEHTALDLCVHPREDGRVTTVQALCDLAALLARQPIDWRRLVTDADAWSMCNYAWLVLTICKAMLNAPVPDSALEGLQACGCRRLSEEGLQRAWSSVSTPLDHQVVPDTDDTRIVALLAQPGARGRLAAALNALFPAPSVVAKQFQLGRAGWPKTIWYYPLRWWGLLARYSGKIAGAWKPAPEAQPSLREQAATVELFAWLDADAGSRPPERAAQPRRG